MSNEQIIAAKDAEIATLKECVLKLQDSLCAAKRHELATPAQPAASMESFLLAAMRRAMTLIDTSPYEARRCLQMAIGGAAHIAQPAAAVSAPTDDVIAFGASLLGHASTTDGMDDNEARTWVRCRWNEWQAARAAAPVSGPTDGECSTCEGMGYTDGQGDECSTCDGKGYLPDAQEQIAALKKECEDWRKAMQAAQREATLWAQKYAAISAAPVSGQGASIGDDAEFRDLLEAYHAQPQNSYEQGDAETALVVYIDSRLRSEDSRAKVLNEAADAICTLARRYSADYSTAVMDAVQAIRALASTPPKADK